MGDALYDYELGGGGESRASMCIYIGEKMHALGFQVSTISTSLIAYHVWIITVCLFAY